MLAETVKEWTEQWVEEGREQGLEQQRALLRRMTASRFGSDAAERLALLARTDAAQDRETSA